MSRIGVILSNIDEALANLYINPEARFNPGPFFHPDIEFKPQVETEAARIEAVIEGCDSKLSRTAERLVSYATYHDPETFYVRSMAMRQVLGHYGLLNVYDWEDRRYGDDQYRLGKLNLSTYKENEDGWVFDMRVPGKDSAQIRVLDVLSTRDFKGVAIGVERWTFSYLAKH